MSSITTRKSSIDIFSLLNGEYYYQKVQTHTIVRAVMKRLNYMHAVLNYLIGAG